MAKIAFINIPAYGHVNPTLPIVRELVKNGHHVIYYSNEEFRDKISPTGVDFRLYEHPIPGTKEVSERMKQMIDASLMFIEMSEMHTAWLIEEMTREQPDLLIYDMTCMWGYVTARVLNIPAICSVPTFVLDGSRSNIPFSQILHHIWTAIPKLPRIIQWKRTMASQFGKENVGGITEYSDRNIVYTSKEFHPENNFVDERFRFVGPSFDENTRDPAQKFHVTGEGQKVYISLGTINNLKTDFYRAAFDAFGDYPAQFILSVGRNTDIANLQPIPDNFSVYNYVPQLQILQQVDVFITHGGINSVQEGLYYGVPEIVVPQQIEQLLNGIRVREVGTGILLGEKAPYGRVSAKELRSALETILHDSSYKTNARSVGQTLRDAGGYQQAVHEIEAYLHQVVNVPEPA